MTDITETGSEAPTVREDAEPGIRADLRMIAFWISLGAVAGGWAGFLVGGIGGRLAMLLLRFTSDDSIRGLDSDDGFTMGRFDISSTVSLLLVTTVLGSIVGLIIAAGRPFFPARAMPWAWGAAGAITGGAILVQSDKDKVDFILLEPTWLAISLFVLIPAAGAFVAAWFVHSWQSWWWVRRGRTIVSAIAALPALIFFPVTIAAVAVGAVWLLALRVRRMRGFAKWQPVRIAAIVVFCAIVLLGAFDLQSDARSLL